MRRNEFLNDPALSSVPLFYSVALSIGYCTRAQSLASLSGV